ncbi:ABC-type xenobiotic transporter [Malassezia sp. CBS 17886]|nr:ABC-type xenobiotic transporter [Malassezia sp. CBS 17886]
MSMSKRQRQLYDARTPGRRTYAVGGSSGPSSPMQHSQTNLLSGENDDAYIPPPGIDMTELRDEFPPSSMSPPRRPGMPSRRSQPRSRDGSDGMRTPSLDSVGFGRALRAGDSYSGPRNANVSTPPLAKKRVPSFTESTFDSSRNLPRNMSTLNDRGPAHDPYLDGSPMAVQSDPWAPSDEGPAFARTHWAEHEQGRMGEQGLVPRHNHRNFGSFGSLSAMGHPLQPTEYGTSHSPRAPPVGEPVDEHDASHGTDKDTYTGSPEAPEASKLPYVTANAQALPVPLGEKAGAAEAAAAPIMHGRKWGGRGKKKGKPSSGEPKSKPASVGSLFRYATPLESLLNWIGLVCAAAAGAAQPLMTILFGNLTTSILGLSRTAGDLAAFRLEMQRVQHSINMDAVYLVVIGLGSFVVVYAYMAIWVYTGEVITLRIRRNYLKAIMRQEIAYFDRLGAGEITTRIQSDIQLIQDGISDKLPLMVSFLSTFITGFIVAYVRNWKLALVMTSILPVIVLTAVVMNIFVSQYQQVELDFVAKAATIAEESLSTVRTAKAFDIGDELGELYDVKNAQATSASMRRAIASGIGIGGFFFAIYSAYALAFYFGSKLVASGEIASGVVMNVIFSVLIGAFSMAMLAPNLQALSFAQAAGGKVYETVDRTSAIDSSGEGGLRPPACAGNISLRNVQFHYPARPDVSILKDFSLDIPAGNTTALVGPSGSGKSTIIALVERFYDPTGGEVLLDGIPLRELNIQWLRTQIGLVSQEPTLFSTTVWENIAYGLVHSGLEHLPMEEKDKLVVFAARQANAHDFISQLPQGYHTQVGERAALLSGGQKQRVCIARAIVKNPRILLLDEATSALDTMSEGVVQEALDRASQGRTTITIAHRLSTIKNADNIVVVKDGLIMERGRHNALLDIPHGIYAGLVSTQKINAKTTHASQRESQKWDDAQEPLYDGPGQDMDYDADELRAPRRISQFYPETDAASTVLKMGGVVTAPVDPAREKMPSMVFLMMRLSRLGRDLLPRYFLPGVVCAVLSGATYPSFSILFGLALMNFAKCPTTATGAPCPEPSRGDMRTTANHHALYFFIIAILSTIATIFQMQLIQQGSAILMQRLRSLMFRAYMRADVSYFDEEDHSSGTLTSSLAENTQKLNSFIGVSMGTIVQSISTLIVGAIIALIYGWKLALVVIACIPFTLSAGFVRLKLVVMKDVKVRKAHLVSSQLACESANSIRTVAALTREDDCLAQYEQSLKSASKIAKHAAIVGNIFYALSQSFSYYVIALGFWYGCRLQFTGEYSAGQFFTIFTAVVFGSIQAGNVFNFVPDISNAHGAATNVFRLLDMRPQIDIDATHGIDLPVCHGHVRFENVHFVYPTRPTVPVLRGVNMDIRPGTYCALVGPSGCGKSTTIQLAERFYDPELGRITIDGHDIRSLNLRSLRRHIALVSQEPTLYDGTIAFNLRLGAIDVHSVTDEQLRTAAAEANILDFIEGLPNGFDTEVGGKGTQLSGGQKQRIAIARALIRNPKILLLDEATSALDSDSEKVVQQALDRAAQGRTTIAIAHRLATIAHADRIFAFQNGAVAEQGDHKALMAQRGIYADLVTLQALEKS